MMLCGRRSMVRQRAGLGAKCQLTALMLCSLHILQLACACASCAQASSPSQQRGGQ